MKNIKIFSLLIFVIFTACDPDNKPIFNNELIKVNATINNSNENIVLGDTLIITFVLPDTVVSDTKKNFCKIIRIWGVSNKIFFN